MSAMSAMSAPSEKEVYPEMIGRVIGNYRITNELAQGGMGSVYRGVHLHLPRQVVVKSILMKSFSVSAQRHLKARFRREACIQSQLDHQNIVRVYEFFAMDDNYYMVMEYVPGMSLKELIRKPGLLGDTQAISLCKQALGALQYAHSFVYKDESGATQRGVIHRDIKPANLLVDRNGRLKITDFGIVKVTSDDGLTQSGFQPGTVEYMSPEQLLGVDVDERSDIYCLGVTFYELLTGRLPFPRSVTGSDWDVRKGHIEKPAPPLQEVRPDINPTLSSILMRTLNKKPEHRFQSTAEFMDSLDGCARSLKLDKSPGFCLLDSKGKPISPFAAVSGVNISINVTDNTVTGPGPVNSSIEFPFRSVPGDRVKAAKNIPGDKHSDTLTFSDILENAEIEEPVALISGGNGSDHIDEKKRGRLFAITKADPPPIKNQSGKSRSRRKVLVSVPIARHTGQWRAAAAIGLSGIIGAAYLLMPGQSDSLKTPDSKTHSPVRVVKSSSPPSYADNSNFPNGILLTRKIVADSTNSDNIIITEEKNNQNIVESSLLKTAQTMEQHGKYQDAVMKYREYLSKYPNGAAAAIASENLSRHQTFNALMKSGNDAIIRGDYDTARLNYKEALRLRPHSRAASVGFADAQENFKTDLKKKIKIPPIRRIEN